MKRPRVLTRQSTQTEARPSPLERLADLIKPDPEDDPEWLRLEDEKLRQARLALFGAAPE